jgi:hypothetical protein
MYGIVWYERYTVIVLAQALLVPAVLAKSAPRQPLTASDLNRTARGETICPKISVLQADRRIENSCMGW